MTGPLLTESLLFTVVADGGKSLLRALDKRTGELDHVINLSQPPPWNAYGLQRGRKAVYRCCYWGNERFQACFIRATVIDMITFE
ncbi:MAG: hypothetical protein ACI92E_000540 [Oceanicoccus sp.]|jgi:hypothetical protein